MASDSNDKTIYAPDSYRANGDVREVTGRKRLERVLESIADGVVIVASNGKIEFVNPPAQGIFSVKEGTELIGLAYQEALGASAGSLNADQFRQLMDTRQPVRFDFHHDLWDVDFCVTAFPVRDGGMSIHYEDVTADRAAQKVLRRERDDLQHLVDSISDGMLTLDTGWHILNANAVTRLLWQRRYIEIADVLGETLQKAFPELVGSAFEKEVRKTMVLRVPRRFELELWGYWFAFQCYPVIGGGVCIYFIDINDRKKAEIVSRKHVRDLQRLVESVADTFQVLSSDWVYRYANESARMLAALEGKPDHIEPGRNFWEVYPELKATPVEEALRHAMYARQPCQFEHMHEERWYLTRAAPIEGDGLSLYTQDITQRKCVENALAESEARWQAVTNAIPQIVWIANAEDGACVFVNEQGIQFTGAPAEAFLGFGWVHFIHPDDRKSAADAWQASREKTERFDVEFRMRRFDGVFCWFKVRGVPVKGDGAKPTAWYGTCTDIQEAVESRLYAQNADRNKSEFLANMSHELRTPLTAIVGLTSIMLRSDGDPDLRRRYLTTMKASADSLTELINDVLEYARLEADKFELSEVDFSLFALVDEVFKIGLVKAHLKGLETEFDFRADRDAHLRGDALRIKQIVLNLLSNAVKFTEAGRIDVTTSLTDIEDGMAEVRVAVKDTGIGLAPDVFERIFEKFSQADSTIVSRFGGTGLGLTISKRFAEAMGGRIELESEPGRGAMFSFVARLRYVSNEPDLPETPDDDEDITSRKGRVLLVEDDTANALVSETMLTRLGYAHVRVTNGRSAIETWRQGDFDLILMDIQMAEMDGLEATRWIRQMEKAEGRSPVTIMAITAHAMSNDHERCVASGIDEYLAKPFDMAALRHKLSQWAASRHATPK